MNSSRFTSEALIQDIRGGAAQILGTRPEHAKGLAVEGAATEEAEGAEEGEGRRREHDARRQLPGEAGRLRGGDGGVQGRPAGAQGGQEIGTAEALGRRRRTGGEAPDAGAELLPASPRVAARPHSTQPGAALRSPSPPPHLPSESGAAGDARSVRGGLSRGAACATCRAPAAITASPSRREGGGGGGAAAAMRRRRAEQGAVLPRMRPRCHQHGGADARHVRRLLRAARRWRRHRRLLPLRA